MQNSSEFSSESSTEPIAIPATSSTQSWVTYKDLDYLYTHVPPEIYGGTSGSLTPISNTSVPSQPTLSIPPITVPTGSWSTSIQTVLDRPPSTLPQRLLCGGLVFCLACGIWANWGQVEEVGRASGQLTPQGEVYKIHPTESGKVVRINVKEGDEVKAGQLLVELDTKIAASEVERLQQMLPAYQQELTQKQDLMEKMGLEAQTSREIARADLQAQAAAIFTVKLKVSTQQRLLRQMQAEARASQSRLKTLIPLVSVSAKRLQEMQADINMHQERVERLKPLVEKGAISKEFLFEAEQTLRDRIAAMTRSYLEEGAMTKEKIYEAERTVRDRQVAIAQTQGDIQQDLAEVERLQALLNQKQAEARMRQLESQQRLGQLEIDVTELKTRIAETQTLLNSAQAKLAQRFLYAPIDGVVSSLNVHNEGEVVQPGQTVAEMARSTAPLILSASLPNREAGFVKVGMPVNIKLDAYPYQDYGVVSGKVVSISPDAKPNEQMGSVYRVKVALERNHVTDERQTIKFKAGQTATADIVIRRRRIIDVLLEPIKQLQKSGVTL